jgi:molybdopterin-guanine dinucleotide biosynthesis protein A
MVAQNHPVIVLAGGKSTRLGRDKASELLAGRPLLQHVIDGSSGFASALVVVTAKGQRLPAVQSKAPVLVVEDDYPEAGPLGGVYSGLNALAADSIDGVTQTALVVACDMPLLQPALLEEVLRLVPGHDAAVPVHQGLPEPLCAAYTTACLEPARKLLEARSYRVSGLLEQIDARLIPEEHWRLLDPEGLSFLNVNRESDLARARELLSGSPTRPEADGPSS